VELVSTGGTARELKDAGIDVRAVEDFTGFPEILDGRVKTLHPRLYAGLLAVRSDPAHLQAVAEHGIEWVDLVCVNLYPFEATAARRDVTDAELIEQVDIGGPTMIRAAAKNHAFAAVVVEPGAYDAVLEELRDTGGTLSMPTREALAAAAFSATARYDTAISRWFAERSEDFPDLHVRAFEKVLDLALRREPAPACRLLRAGRRALHVLSMIRSTTASSSRTTTCSTSTPAGRNSPRVRGAGLRDRQHNNPCGVGVGRNGQEAYERAFSADPISAFGGVIRGQPHDRPRVRRELTSSSSRCLFAPGYDGRRARDPHQKAKPAACSRTTSAACRWLGEARRPARCSAASSSRTATTDMPTAPRCRSSTSASRPRRVGRAALRVEGVQARQVQRDRPRARARDVGIGGRADEPRRLRPPRRREEPGRAGRARAGLGRVLPVRRRAAGRVEAGLPRSSAGGPSATTRSAARWTRGR
jgi:hypothetical protein